MLLDCTPRTNLNLYQELFFYQEYCLYLPVNFSDLYRFMRKELFTIHFGINYYMIFSSDFLSIKSKDYNLQKPMATPQEFVLSCEKAKDL